MIAIGHDLAVIVCAGPSLDRLPREVWRELAGAGAIVSVNGAIAAAACAGVRFTYVSAMDAGRGLSRTVPRFDALWATTSAWRLSMVGAEGVEAETYIREVDERDGVEGWSDEEDAGYAGGSSAMVTVNWLCNRWSQDPAARAARERLAFSRWKAVPPRGFRRVAFLGLDMRPGEGGHARGAGDHTSGFALSPARYESVSKGWLKVCREASRRGIEILNFTPDTGLLTMPRASLCEEVAG